MRISTGPARSHPVVVVWSMPTSRAMSCSHSAEPSSATTSATGTGSCSTAHTQLGTPRGSARDERSRRRRHRVERPSSQDRTTPTP